MKKIVITILVALIFIVGLSTARFCLCCRTSGIDKSLDSRRCFNENHSNSISLKTTCCCDIKGTLDQPYNAEFLSSRSFLEEKTSHNNYVISYLPRDFINNIGSNYSYNYNRSSLDKLPLTPPIFLQVSSFLI